MATQLLASGILSPAKGLDLETNLRRHRGKRNYRLYKIRTAPLSERCSIENYHSKIIAGVLKNEKH